jgi:hypothetical protein
MFMGFPNNMLRLRDDATVKQLDISKDKLEVIQKVMSSGIANSTKISIVKRLTGGSQCCVCGGVPSLQVSYPINDEKGNATRIERYCGSCIQKVYEREQVL